jgi:hypothetical protein
VLADVSTSVSIRGCLKIRRRVGQHLLRTPGCDRPPEL